MKVIYDINGKESLENFLELLKVIDDFLRMLPLKDNPDLSVKVEVETRYGIIFRFQRCFQDLLNEETT